MTELERKVEALIRCVGQGRFEEKLRQIQKADKPMRVGSRDIEDLLTQIGIPSSLSGYDYLCDAIEIRIANARAKVVTDVYGKVAKDRGIPASKVERNIRHAIEDAWSWGDMDLLGEMFGNSIDPARGKPRNKEFIDRVARVIMRRREDGC